MEVLRILKKRAFSSLTLLKTACYPYFMAIASRVLAKVLCSAMVSIKSAYNYAVHMVCDSKRWFWYLPGLRSISLRFLTSEANDRCNLSLTPILPLKLT